MSNLIDDSFLEILGVKKCNFDFEIIKSLDKYDQIFLVKDLTGEKFVWKKFNKISSLKKELEIYSKLKNSNYVAQLEGLNLKDKSSLLLKYYSNGNLKDFLENEGFITSEEILFNIINILKELESKNVIHLDLKPENILVTKNRKLVICDFDCSKKDINETITNKGYVGTLHYTAPEVLSTTDIKITHQVDIFSMGKILYYYFTKEDKIDFNHYNYNFDQLIPFPYNYIIDKMIKHSPEERYKTSAEIEDDFLEYRSFLSDYRIKDNERFFILEYFNYDKAKSKYSEQIIPYLFYYSILSKQFDLTFLTNIIFKDKIFDFEKLINFYNFDKILFSKLLKHIIFSIKQNSVSYSFEYSEILFEDFFNILYKVKELNLRIEIIEFLCYITIVNNRFENMDRINKFLIGDNSPELKLFFLTSLVKYNSQSSEVGFLKDIENFEFKGFTFQEFISNTMPNIEKPYGFRFKHKRN